MTTKQTLTRTRVEQGVWKRGDMYEITWRDSAGKQRRRKVEGGLLAARNELAKEVAKRSMGAAVSANPRLTFADAAQTWLDQYAVPNLRPGTVRSYRVALKHLLPALGRRRLSDITPGVVASYVKTKETTLKGQTVRVHLVVLSAIMRYSIRRLGFAGPNPVAQLDRRERPNTSDARERRALTSSEIKALLAAAPDRTRLLLRLASETGMRVSEVLGLTWADVDLSDRPAITVNAQLSRATKADPSHRAETKTANSERRIIVTTELATALKEHKLASRYSAPDSYVFSTPKGGGRNYSNISRDLKTAAKDAGLDPAITFHWMRHTFASRLIASGWPITTVATMLGDTPATMLRTYLHEFDAAAGEDDQRVALAAMAM
jgi:integrase